MELTKYQIQKLIDFKNELLEDSEDEYAWASVEEDDVEEAKFQKSSEVKYSIAQEIERIIYNK